MPLDLYNSREDSPPPDSLWLGPHRFQNPQISSALSSYLEHFQYTYDKGAIEESEAVWSNNPAKIYAEYDELRKQCPIVWVNRHGGYWMLTR